MKIKVLLFFLLPSIFVFTSPSFAFGPFPITGEILDEFGQKLGEAKVYPQYVEVYDSTAKLSMKVGVIEEGGLAKLFIVSSEESQIIGYAKEGMLFNKNDEKVGFYVVTPTYSYAYREDGKKAGSVKCIAWPRVCAAGIAGYLLIMS